MKLKKIVLSVFALIIALCPILAKADLMPVVLSSHSVQTTVGSEIVFKLTGFKFENDKITYNPNEVEFVSVQVTSTNVLPDIVPEFGEVKISSNENGILSYTYVPKDDADFTKNLEFKFKVKSAPADSKIVINYVPSDKSSIYGKDSISAEYTVITNKDCDCKNTETKTETDKTEACNNDVLLYVSWGVSAALLLVVIILLVTKRKPKPVVTEQQL